MKAHAEPRAHSLLTESRREWTWLPVAVCVLFWIGTADVAFARGRGTASRGHSFQRGATAARSGGIFRHRTISRPRSTMISRRSAPSLHRASSSLVRRRSARSALQNRLYRGTAGSDTRVLSRTRTSNPIGLALQKLRSRHIQRAPLAKTPERSRRYLKIPSRPHLERKAPRAVTNRMPISRRTGELQRSTPQRRGRPIGLRALLHRTETNRTEHADRDSGAVSRARKHAIRTTPRLLRPKSDQTARALRSTRRSRQVVQHTGRTLAPAALKAHPAEKRTRAIHHSVQKHARSQDHSDGRLGKRGLLRHGQSARRRHFGGDLRHHGAKRFGRFRAARLLLFWLGLRHHLHHRAHVYIYNYVPYYYPAYYPIAYYPSIAYGGIHYIYPLWWPSPNLWYSRSFIYLDGYRPAYSAYSATYGSGYDGSGLAVYDTQPPRSSPFAQAAYEAGYDLGRTAAVAAEPEQPVEQIDRMLEGGLEAMRAGDYDSARRYFVRVLLRRPDDGRVRTYYVAALMADGQYTEAAICLRRALQLWEDVELGEFDLAELFSDQRTLEQQVAALRTFVADNPERLDGWLLLTWAYAFSGEREDARLIVAEARRTWPDDPTLLHLEQILRADQ